MRSPRLLDLLVLGLSVLSVAEATMVDMNAARLAFRNGVAIQKRQLSGTGSSSTSSPSSTTAPPAPSSTPPTPSTTTPTSTPTLSPSRSSSSSQSSSSTQPGTTSSSASITPPPNTSGTSTSLIVETSTTFITTTGSNGQSTTITSELTTTQTPGLANNNGSGAQTGMTSDTRNIVIGVVVGIGGAIILGGLAFVAWRIWGRKKAAEENDDLMDYPSTAGGEKPDTGNSMNGRTPFQSTLESYHTPTQVNTASNF